MEAKRLSDEVVTLKTAIEEARINGQKSKGDLNDIPKARLVPDEDFDLAHINTNPGVVGWVNDF